MGKEVTVTQKKTKSDLKKETSSGVTPLSKGNASRDGKTSQSGSLSNMGSVSANAHSKSGYSLPADKKSVKTLGSHNPKSSQQYYGGFPASFVTSSKMGGVGGEAFSGHQFTPNMFPEDPRLQFSGPMTKPTGGSSSSHSARMNQNKQPDNGSAPWNGMNAWNTAPPGMYPPHMADWNNPQGPGYPMPGPRNDQDNGGEAPPGFQNQPKQNYPGMVNHPGMPPMPNFMYPFPPHQMPQGAQNPMMMKPGPYNQQWPEAPRPVDGMEDFGNQGDASAKSLPYKFTPKPPGATKNAPINYQKQMQRVIHLPPDHHHMQQRGPPMQPPMGYPPGLGLPGYPPGPVPPGFGGPMNYYPPGGNFQGGPPQGQPGGRVPPYPGGFQYRMQPGNFAPDLQNQPLKPPTAQPVRVLPRNLGPIDNPNTSMAQMQPGSAKKQPEQMPGPVPASDSVNMNLIMSFMDNDQDGSDGEREPQSLTRNQPTAPQQ